MRSRIGSLPPVLARRATSDRLRVLAYHDVQDPVRFSKQLAHLTRLYTPVTAEEVIGAFRSGAPLPTRPVWITFDDGDRSVIEHGQPVLDRAGVKATLFVCPALVTSGEGLWTDRVRAAGVGEGRRRFEIPPVPDLKKLPDEHRRAILAELPAGEKTRRVSADEDELGRWIEAGHTLGNHTWDHPCLDRCTPEQQRWQIDEAQAWLATRLGVQHRLFAYPDGAWDALTESYLGDTGYDLAVLFDHRLSNLRQPRLRVSRLRVSAHAELDRFSLILSGAHSLGFALAQALRVRDPEPRRNP